MDARRLVVAVLLIGWCGCTRMAHRNQLDYRTIAADPRHDTDRARAETERAIELFQNGEVEKAEQALQRALIADVTYGPAHNNLGRYYLSQGKYYLAAWEFEYAIRLMPERPEPHNNLGLLYEDVGRLDEAVKFYELAHDLQPEDPNFIGNLARARLRRGDSIGEVRQLLSDLLLRDTRCEWVDWAKENLALADQTVQAVASGTSSAPNNEEPAVVRPGNPSQGDL
jgi:Flp pilus assembly protein TadD